MSLEDKILKQNVPGRWTDLDDRRDVRIEEEENDFVDEDNDDGTRSPLLDDKDKKQIETDRLLNHDGIPDHVKAGILQERSRKAGTGIKVPILPISYIF